VTRGATSHECCGSPNITLEQPAGSHSLPRLLTARVRDWDQNCQIGREANDL
jgi:hypothetical protein